MKFASVHDVQPATFGEALRASSDENRRRYIAQSAMTKAGAWVPCPTLAEVERQFGRIFRGDAFQEGRTKGGDK